MNTRKLPVERAFDLFDTQSEFAKACGVSQVSVHKWLKGGNIDPKNAINIEAATRLKNPHKVVSKWELNSIFDKPEQVA